jgi:transposase-like protein
MIRLCTAFFKALLEIIITDEEIFYDATGAFSYSGARCPRCGAIGKLTPHGDYTRYLISFEYAQVFERLIAPLRFFCSSCKSTHALLPDIITPYSPYSLRFKLTALIAYYERDTTVEAVCGRFGNAISTLYVWKERLLEHKDLMLGALISLKTPALAFLRNLHESTSLSKLLSEFFHQYAFSFLQGRAALATRIHSP